jgi:LytS/YehU family sensor histidine kinase
MATGMSNIKFVVFTFVFILIYVLLGNARSVEPNPFIPGAVIAFNMVVIVIAGIIGGKRMGAIVGFFATLFNTLSPAGSVFEFAAIIPHTIMGFSAGYLRSKMATPFVALTLLIGHGLNLLFFLVFGLMSYTVLLQGMFWVGIGYETFLGIIGVIITHAIYRIGIEHGTHN